MSMTVYLITMWVHNNRMQPNDHVSNNHVQHDHHVEAFQNPRLSFFKQKENFSTSKFDPRASRSRIATSQEKKRTACCVPENCRGELPESKMAIFKN